MRRLSFTDYGVEQAPAAVTIGNFDGVHLGHKALIDVLYTHARKDGLITCAVTFDPTPGEYFSTVRTEHQPPARLLSTADRIEKLLQAGIDRVLVLDFDQLLQEMSAQRFFRDIITDLCQAQTVVLGQDFRFGKHRHGNMDLLYRLARESNCSIQSVQLLHKGKTRISSSIVRSLLADNQVESANTLLGYEYAVKGIITHGDGRGRDLGYATANLETDIPLLLNGVFATRMELADKTILEGVTNIGNKPTFDGRRRSCETHLFDFTGNVYNQTVRLHFCKYLRPEQAFDSTEKLVRQIQRDVDNASRYFQQGNERGSV